MKIEHLNATFQPAKIGNPHGLQITYLKDNSTRNIFVYHEDGKVRAHRYPNGRWQVPGDRSAPQSQLKQQASPLASRHPIWSQARGLLAAFRATVDSVGL